jgi:hypothetical protein
MFKVNHLFGGNGSLPSIGGTTLAASLAGVERAEQALEAARALARSAAKREGKSVRGLFEDSKFILRASGEKWADEGRRAGEKVMADIFTRGLNDAEGTPFEHLAARLKREGAPKPDEMRRHWAALDAAGFLTATRAGDYEEAARIVVEVNREWAGKSKAEKILAAGARARMSGDNERPLPPKDSLPAQIVRAGQRRRGEIE